MSFDEGTADRLRYAFRVFNKLMVAMGRLGLGRWINIRPEVFGRIMVIRHIGRRTQLARPTPVNFTLDRGDVYCAAGFGVRSDWYRNIQDDPVVEVWLPDGWWIGLMEDVTD